MRVTIFCKFQQTDSLDASFITQVQQFVDSGDFHRTIDSCINNVLNLSFQSSRARNLCLRCTERTFFCSASKRTAGFSQRSFEARGFVTAYFALAVPVKSGFGGEHTDSNHRLI